MQYVFATGDAVRDALIHLLRRHCSQLRGRRRGAKLVGVLFLFR
jgi:hypothetical protein